jgi:predicted CXXCH cytochrome family protein
MRNKKKVIVLAGILALVLIALFSCASQQVAPEKPAQVAQAPAQPETPTVEVKPKSPYEADIKPLAPADCARCHFSVFSQIKTEGGKHKLDCTQCHVKYHAFNPKKQNWDEIMPKCETCHGKYHGDKFVACMQCHAPHAPKTQIAVNAETAKTCADCHGKVAQEIQKVPTKHTKVACATCHHSKHGLIPSCMQCHKPHAQGQTDKDCLSCHPAHSPLNITYSQMVPNAVCGGCHKAVFDKLMNNPSKHGAVSCATCHTKHRFIPKCEGCHGKPHGEGLIKKFPDCSQCHISAHDLPSKAK